MSAAAVAVRVNCPEFPEGSFRRYLSELAAEIVAAGDPNGDLIAEMQAAHARRQAVAREMAKGTSDRARIIRRVIATQVWGNVRAHAAMESTLAGLVHEFRPERTHAVAVACLEGCALTRRGGAA